MPILFIAEQPKVIIEPDGIKTVARSGNEIYERRFTRATWRRFLETAIRQLDDYEVAERAERQVVNFRKERHG